MTAPGTTQETSILTPDELDRLVILQAYDAGIIDPGIQVASEKATHVIAQSRDRDDRDAATSIVEAIHNHLRDDFHRDNAERDMHRAYEVGAAALVGSQAVSVGAVRLYKDRSTNTHLDGQAGIVGPLDVDIWRKKGFWKWKRYVLDKSISPSPAAGAAMYVTENADSLKNLHTEQFKLKPGDRMVMSTPGVALGDVNKRHAKQAMNSDKLGQELADSILANPDAGTTRQERGRSLVYIEHKAIDKKRRMLPFLGAGAMAGATSNGADGQSTRGGFIKRTYNKYLNPFHNDQRRPLGATGTAATAATTRIGRIRAERYDKRMQANRGSTRYDANMSDDDKDADFRRRHNRSMVGLGLSLATALITYRFVADPGQDGTGTGWTSLGEVDDKGMDLLPNLPGIIDSDVNDGDGIGFDLNPFNYTTTANDDPVKAHIDTLNEFDMVSEYWDGDGRSYDGRPFYWPWQDADVDIDVPEVPPTDFEDIIDGLEGSPFHPDWWDWNIEDPTTGDGGNEPDGEGDSDGGQGGGEGGSGAPGDGNEGDAGNYGPNSDQSLEDLMNQLDDMFTVQPKHGPIKEMQELAGRLGYDIPKDVVEQIYWDLPDSVASNMVQVNGESIMYKGPLPGEWRIGMPTQRAVWSDEAIRHILEALEAKKKVAA